MFNAGQPEGTVYNIFVYEYNQLLLIKAAPNMWVEATSEEAWREFWNTLSSKDQEITTQYSSLV
jgi:hypothetical protein